MRLGRLPARVDKRTLKLTNILNVAALPPLPGQFDVDFNLHADILPQMFGNDTWGDCVIAGRANWTLRAEYFEQKIILPITTAEVLKEYWIEQGGGCCRHPDNGLVMLDSLNDWRSYGWKTAKNVYAIFAFAGIDWKNHDEFCYATFLLGGGYIGIDVPESAITQFNKEQPWTVVPDSNIVGGHCIYIVAYNNTGPICVTWGRRQQMTWEFLDTYCEEAYAIVDKPDRFVQNSPVDLPKLVEYLNILEAL